jgi:hypothetical protein
MVNGLSFMVSEVICKKGGEVEDTISLMSFIKNPWA